VVVGYTTPDCIAHAGSHHTYNQLAPKGLTDARHNIHWCVQRLLQEYFESNTK